MRLHFREQGSGPVVIILHGLFGSLDNWAYISQQLSEQFRVISVDQRNHGQSPHDPEMNYSALARDLKEFIEHHGFEKSCVMGHSMGGKAAMQLALTSPELVERLIVVDMAPRAYPRKHDRIFAAMLGLDLRKYQTRSEIEAALEPDVPEMEVRRFLLKGVVRQPEGGFEWKFNLRALHEHYPELSGELPATGRFERPTLFIRGEESDYIRDDDSETIQRIFLQSRIVAIPGASHWVHAEKPENFLSAVMNFLKEKI